MKHLQKKIRSKKFSSFLCSVNMFFIAIYKPVAYSSQGSHKGQLDFYWLSKRRDNGISKSINIGFLDENC